MSLYDDFLKTQGGGPEDPTPTTPKPTTTKPASGGGLFADFQATQGGTKQPSDTSVVTPPVKMSPDVVSAVDGFGKTTYEPAEKPSTLKKIWYGLGAGAKGFIQQIGTGINEYNKFAYGKVLGGKDIFGADYEATYQKDKAVLDKYAATTQAKLEANLGTEGANSFVTQASEGLVQGAGQIASFFVNPVVGFTTIAAQTIGAGKSAYDEAYTSSIAQGKTPDEARRIGNINGIATGIINALEIIPVGRAVGLGEKLLGGSLEKGLAKTATRLLTDVAIESGTEGIQQAGQDLTAKLTYDKDRHVVRNAINAALTAIPSALLFAGVGEGGKRIDDAARNQVMEEASTNMQNQMIQSGIPAEKAKAIADQAVAQYAVMGNENVFDIPEVMNTKPTPEEIAQQVEITPEPVQQVAENVDVTPANNVELLYHGSKVKGFTHFDPKYHPVDDAPAFFFTPDKNEAVRYASMRAPGEGQTWKDYGGGGDVVHANIDTSKFYNATNEEWVNGLDYNKLKSEGYTGVKIAPPLESADSFTKSSFGDKPTYAVFDTNNIKIKGVQDFSSAMNNEPLQNNTSTPTTITPKMTSDLASQGFTPEEISVMKPETAHKILKTVGGGETKASKLALGIEAQAIERKIQTQGFDNLSESERAVMKDQRAMAEDFLSTDPEKAKRIALGQEEAPADMLSSVLFQKVVEDATKRADGQLLAQLATSPLNNEATAAGQFIRGLAEFRDGGSAFENIQKVTKNREKIAEKNLKGKTISKAKKEIVNDIKAEIKKQKPKIKEWIDLVNSLEC